MLSKSGNVVSMSLTLRLSNDTKRYGGAAARLPLGFRPPANSAASEYKDDNLLLGTAVPLLTMNSDSETDRYFKQYKAFGVDVPSTMFTIDPQGYIRVPPYAEPNLNYPIYFCATFVSGS